MEESDKEEGNVVNPRETAGVLSALTFWWLAPLVWRWDGYKTTLISEWRVLDEHRSDKLGDALETAWIKQLRSGRPSLAKALLSVFWKDLTICSLAFGFLELIVKMCQPLAVGYMVGHFQNSTDESSLYLSAGVLLTSSIASVLIYFPTIMGLTHCALKMKIALASLLFRKSLRLNGAGNGALAGRVISLMTGDVGRLDLLIIFIHNLWIGPLVSFASGFIIYTKLGLVALLGLILILLSIPLQARLTKISAGIHKRAASETDKRIGLMSDIIRGIRTIKIHAWELPFSRSISDIRNRELRLIRRAAYIKGVHIAFQGFRSRAAVLVSALTYVGFGGVLTAEGAFVLTACFQTMKRTMTDFFSYSIEQIFLTKVSLKRIKNFLLLEETPHSENTEIKPNETASIISKSVRVAWNDENFHNSDFILNVDDLKLVGPGMVAVVGPVGSGKSTFLMLLLRELLPNEGLLKIVGRVSYAAQEPWLFDRSIKRNIVLDSPFNEEHYRTVLKVCDLEHDLQNMSAGDLTMAGEKGAALSGGQRARIALARALYRDADIYLLDDPLASLDDVVANRVFDRITELLKPRLCLFVTNRKSHAGSCDMIVHVNNGCVSVINDFTLATLPVVNTQLGGDDCVDIKKPVLNNINDDDRTNGRVAIKTFVEYIRVLGRHCTAVGLLLLFIAAQTSASASDWFLAKWVSNGLNFERDLYGWLVLVTLVLTIGSSFVAFWAGTRAAGRLHESMFGAVAAAPLTFFETRDVGRVLNRFSRDVHQLDEIIPSATVNALQATLAVGGAVILISITQKVAAILSLAGFITLIYVRNIYVRVLCELRRTEASSRAPMLQHATALIDGGLINARAFRLIPRLQHEFDKFQDSHSTARYLVQAATRMFAMWMEAVCTLLLSTVVIEFLFTDSVSGGVVGLSLTQAISTIGLIQWAVRQSAELEGGMTAVERVLHYSRIEGEDKSTKNPPPNWPDLGELSFEHVGLSYGKRQALRDIHTNIPPGEKLGIVGRTGAGKSSLINALLRLYPLEGRVLIDGVDSKTINVRLWRSHISIVPQTPTIFLGRSLRQNLDPFEIHSDEKLWEALRTVRLERIIPHLDAPVDDTNSNNSINLSVGQKQLLCFARALLTDNKLLVLDEATSNLDVDADRLLQDLIKSKFVDWTVVIVAHRLQHVMECDRLLVLVDGVVTETGTPSELSSRPGGYLATLLSNDRGDSIACEAEL